MPVDRDEERDLGADAVLVLCAALVVAGLLVSVPQMAPTAEEFGVEGLYRGLGWTGTWCSSAPSYRPLCGALLLLEDGLDHWVKQAISVAGHVVAAALAGGLGVRLQGRRAGLIAAVVPLVWSTQPEVTLWLGGRCELVWALPALAATHAALTGLRRDDVRWTMLGGTLAALSALGKEPGYTLPAVFFFMGIALRPMRIAAKHALLSAAALVPALALRTWVMSQAPGEGYVGRFASRSVFDWLGNLAYGVTKLAIGTTVRWPVWVAVVVPVGLALGAWWILRNHSRRTVAAAAGAIAILLLPTALVHAPRTLYGAVLALGVVCGLAARDRRVRWALVGAVVLHCASSVVGQRLWVETSESRARLAADVARIAEARGVQNVVLVTPRDRPWGIRAGTLSRHDFPPRLRVWSVGGAQYDENGSSLLRPSSLVSIAPCSAELDHAPAPGAFRAHPQLSATRDGRRLRLEVSEPALVVYGDADERVRYALLPCEDEMH